MPRKTKDTENEVKTKTKTKTTTKTKKIDSNSSVKKTTSKKSPLKETANTKKKTTTTKAKKTVAKTEPKKTTTKAKTKKTVAKAEPKKTATKAKTKKTVAKTEPKKTTTKAKAKKPSTTTKAKKISPKTLEYYDLPYRYNETTVKILAQTPKKLFIYWDIADADREKYINQFGNDFFNNTKPILIIHNDTLNYTFEVEINDFANCWYLDITDSKAKYTIELGRRSKVQNYYIPNDYIFIANSNIIESPNDHILFEQQTKTIYFRNVKNNSTYSKDLTDLSFIRRIGKIYNIYDAYKNLYNETIFDFDLNNPSSGNPTSTFK